MFDRINRDRESEPAGIKGFFYWWLESDENDRRYLFDLFISSVIILSIVIIILDVSYGPSSNTPSWIWKTNLICLVIFIGEYLLRFWVNTDFLADCKEEGIWVGIKNKLLWMVQPFSIIDLVAIIPVGALRSLRIFRFFRIARLLRVLKLGRYSDGFSGFVEEIKNRSFELFALAGVVCAVILIGATAIFTVESPHVEGSLITGFGDALWWATVTTTTVGYGDIYPKHLAGRLIASALMLSSIGIVGALGGILTSAMMERIRKMREGRIERITFEDHLVFCGWTSCAEKVAESLEQVGLFDTKKLVVVNEDHVPEQDYLLALEGDFTRPDHLATVNAGDAEYVVIFYQMNDDITEEVADRKSVLTALQVESINPDRPEPYSITEVYDRESAELITGQEIKGDETIDKEEFDSNLIINTIQYPGHTSKMFYNLSDFSDQWIRLRPVREVVSGDELPVNYGDIKRKMNEQSNEVIPLGVLEQDTTDPVLNPKNSEDVPEDALLYVIEESPYQMDHPTHQKGAGETGLTIEEKPLYEMEEDFVFLGFNRCARNVLDHLENSRWVDNDRNVVVVSERTPPEKPWIDHVETNYAESEAIRDPSWWKNKKLAVIFHEKMADKDESPHEIDIKNAIMSLVLPDDVRIIAEIIEEDYARVLQQDIERDIELIYKERFDANLIANSIINEGAVSNLFRKLASLSGNHLKTGYLSDVVQTDESCSVSTLKTKLLDRDQITFLGFMQEGMSQPVLNPPSDEEIKEGDILYYIVNHE
jgi:voltage-gated potassium channel